MMWALGAAAAILIAVAVHMFLLAPRVLTVSRVALPIADLPPSETALVTVPPRASRRSRSR